MTFIDLRSDTVTQPTPEMRAAMAAAPVGDDVYDDDPTVQKLEALAADMTGFQCALFCPSGTMANQLAIMAHTMRGNEVILGQNSHIVAHEVGGAAILSSVSYRIVDNPDDTIRGEDIHRLVRGQDIHYPETGLVCLENALGNGTVVPLALMKEAYDAAKAHHLPVHLDGARLFNAATHLGVDAKELTAYCDSVMFCLSKGLCAPVGSMLCGGPSFISRAKKFRKLLGGGMRQTGVLAACGLISLEKMTKRLYVDHENARYLAEKLAQIPWVNVDIDKVQINMVFFKVVPTEGTPAFDDAAFVAYMLDNGIKINGAEQGLFRFVTHHDITRRDIDTAVEKIKQFGAHATSQ